MKTILLFSVILLSLNGFCQTQNDKTKTSDKSFGLGVIVGNPNIIGLDAEYLLPIRKKMFVGLGLTVLPNFAQSGNCSASLYYGGFNLGYYILKPYKGLYCGTGYFYRYVNNHETNLIYGGRTGGTSNYGYSISTFKLDGGYKFTLGWLMLKPEIGLGINSWKRKMAKVEKYPDGFEQTTEIDLNNITNSKFDLLATLSIGIAF